MRNPSLKTFVTEKFNRYLNEYYKDYKRTKNSLLGLASKDFRLKMVCASYYAVKGNFQLAKLFNAEYKDIKAFLSLDDKYLMEYKLYLEDAKRIKLMYHEKLENIIEDKSLTIYAVAKLMNTSQINVTRFLNDKQLDKLSNEKIKLFLKVAENLYVRIHHWYALIYIPLF